MRDDFWPLCIVLIVAVLILYGSLLGCSFLTPGFDTRQAAETRDLVETAGDDLRSSVNSTHAGTTVIAQTGGAVTPASQPGDPPTILTGDGGWVYYRESDPRDVLVAYAALGQANAEAWRDTLQLIRDLLPGVMPFVATSAPSP